jgi:Asp-tRNA(Asn)/Glu-tRNA(Gln) amidotransferase A subunit family amidase
LEGNPNGGYRVSARVPLSTLIDRDPDGWTAIAMNPACQNDPRTTIGPMARFVEDLALALPILLGMDWQDASVIPMPLAGWRAVDVGSLRVAYYTHHTDLHGIASAKEMDEHS